MNRYLAKRRRAKKAKGICICCSRKAVKDRVRCTKCLKQQRACEQKRRGPSIHKRELNDQFIEGLRAAERIANRNGAGRRDGTCTDREPAESRACYQVAASIRRRIRQEARARGVLYRGHRP